MNAEISLRTTRDRVLAAHALRSPTGRAIAGTAAVLFALAAATACSSRTEDAAAGGAAAQEGGEAGEARDGAEAGGEAHEGEQAASGNRVTLSEVAFATARIVVEPARGESASDVQGGLEVPGRVEFDPARVALVSPRTSGRIERLLVVPLDRVGAGQPVALLYSPAYVTAQTDLQQAKRRADALAGTADEEGARALLTAARRRLELLGATPATIEQLEAGGEPERFLTIRAPFAGSIVEANVLTGAAVEAGAPLFKIADVSAVNVAADVPERALRALRTGQGASIRVPAFPDAGFAGRVTRISDQLDPATRTAEALIQVANTNRSLRPGMYATVTLRVTGAGARSEGSTVITMPASAIIVDGDARYVFVQVGPYSFERRSVRLASGVAPGAGPGGGFGGRAVVLEGLAPGERVVIQGAFTLNSELAKASFAEDEH